MALNFVPARRPAARETTMKAKRNWAADGKADLAAFQEMPRCLACFGTGGIIRWFDQPISSQKCQYCNGSGLPNDAEGKGGNSLIWR